MSIVPSPAGWLHASAREMARRSLLLALLLLLLLLAGLVPVAPVVQDDVCTSVPEASSPSSSGLSAAAAAAAAGTGEPSAARTRSAPVRRQLQRQALRPGSAAPPHLVVALFDDLGYNDLGSFSNPRGDTPRTPYMDSLMRDGIVLTNFITQPLCSPARAALMTGRYPIRYGAQTGVLVLHKTFVPLDEVMLSERLQAANFATAIIGKW